MFHFLLCPFMKSILLTFPITLPSCSYLFPSLTSRKLPCSHLGLLSMFFSTFSFWALRAGPANLPGLGSKSVSFLLQRNRHIPTEKTFWQKNFLCVVFCINFNLLLILKPNQIKQNHKTTKKLIRF